MNSAINKEGPPLDLGVLDITTMFDALWVEECCNDWFEAGIVDDKRGKQTLLLYHHQLGKQRD